MLNIKNTIIDFLYIYNFHEIITLTNELIMLYIENFKIKITGSDLKIKKINSSELLIEGNIISIGKIYE